MHAALSSQQGCSQVPFLETLSRHVHSITSRVQRVVWWAQCVARRLAWSIKEKSQRYGSRKIFLIFVMCKYRFSERVLNLSIRPSQTDIHFRCASSVPRRVIDMVTTGDDNTHQNLSKAAPKPSRETYLISPLPTTNSRPLFPRPGQLRLSVRFGNGVVVPQARPRRAAVPDGPFWQTRVARYSHSPPNCRRRRDARRRTHSIL